MKQDGKCQQSDRSSLVELCSIEPFLDEVSEGSQLTFLLSSLCKPESFRRAGKPSISRNARFHGYSFHWIIPHTALQSRDPTRSARTQARRHDDVGIGAVPTSDSSGIQTFTYIRRRARVAVVSATSIQTGCMGEMIQGVSLAIPNYSDWYQFASSPTSQNEPAAV
jgi:hypothetical protein